jgi:hypothetical protein
MQTKLKGRVNWSAYKADKLVSRMKIHEERLKDRSTGIKYRTMSSNEKSERIKEALAKENRPILRTASQIADKWERMTTEFKKVYDWDKHPPSGKPDYWNMPPEMRKDQKMPRIFPKTLFDRSVMLDLAHFLLPD